MDVALETQFIEGFFEYERRLQKVLSTENFSSLGEKRNIFVLVASGVKNEDRH